jgi:predicted dehydrogenase
VNKLSEPLGVAVIGCGYWGVNYLRVVDELPNAHLAAICDERIQRLEEIGQRYPDAQLVQSIEELLQLNGVDVVVIAIGATGHFEAAHRCLEAGKPVLVEKPMTMEVDEANQLIHLAQRKRLTLMVGHTFLYNSGVRKVKEYIEQSRTGSIYYIYSRRTNLGPIRSDVDALWDLAPHDVSIINYLLDSRPQWVSAVGTSVLGNGRADVGFLTLGYDNNIVANIHVSWADPNKVRELVIVGSERRIVFDDLNSQEQVRVFEKGVVVAEKEPTSYGEYHFQIRDGDIISPKIELSEPLKVQCAEFLECVIENKTPVSNSQTGRDVVQVLKAADRSLELNGAPIYLDHDMLVFDNAPIVEKRNGASLEIS